MKKLANVGVAYLIGAVCALISVALFMRAWETLPQCAGLSAIDSFIAGNGEVHPLFTFRYALGAMFVTQIVLLVASALTASQNKKFKIALVITIILLVIVLVATVPVPFFKIYIRPLAYVFSFSLTAFGLSFALEGFAEVLEKNRKIKDSNRVLVFQKILLTFALIAIILGAMFCVGFTNDMPIFAIAGNCGFFICFAALIFAIIAFFVAQKAIRAIK